MTKESHNVCIYKRTESKKAIKEQFKAALLLKEQLAKQYSTQELNDLNQAQVQTSLNQLCLVNQAIRKEYQLTDSSYKLDGAPGIVYSGNSSQYSGITLPIHGLLAYINNYGGVSYTYLSNAQQHVIRRQIAKQNVALSHLLSIWIPSDNLYTFEFHQYIKGCKEDLIQVNYHQEIELPILEALASYHKKDIVLIH